MKSKRILKFAGVAAGAAAAAAAVFWASLGPDWRALLADPPTNRDVLFWSVQQRDAGFRLIDRVPFLAKAAEIPASDSPMKLRAGPPLDLDIDLDAYMEKARVAAIVVVHDGNIRIERYGLGFGPDGRWTSFSVAKSLTSTLVGAAIKDGSIESLADPVSKYVKGLAGSAYDDVSIEQLLTMTSGVAWNEDYEDPNSDVARFIDQRPEGGESAIVSYMRRLPRAHPPGEVWHYSSGETNLIGALVAEATGKPLSAYLAEKIWRPFGMEAEATWLLAEDGREISGCCIQANTRDFARFGLFALAGGRVDDANVVPEDWFEKATRKQADIGRPGEGYGYQWWTYDDGAFLATGIFGQGIFIDPARDLVIASNGDWRSALGRRDGERDLRDELHRSIQAAIDAEAE